MLENNYKKTLECILNASDLINEWTIKGDIDKVDLYRIYLNEMIDNAVKIKKYLNHERSKKHD